MAEDLSVGHELERVRAMKAEIMIGFGGVEKEKKKAERFQRRYMFIVLMFGSREIDGFVRLCGGVRRWRRWRRR